MSGCLRERELEAALDGRLDPDSTREVMQHVAGCPECREAKRSFEALAELARRLPPAEPDVLASRRMRAALMGEALMGRAPRSHRGTSRVAMAAAAMMVFFVGVVGAWAGALAWRRVTARAPSAPPQATVARSNAPPRRPTPPRENAVDARAPEVPEAPVALPTAPAVIPPRAVPPSDRGVAFREGSLAYARGDHSAAERSLGRFLAIAPRSDPRREDARYLRVLSLHALERTEAVYREAAAYLREFPEGLRRPEVVLTSARALAGDGRCDEAALIARAMPEGAPRRLRDALAQALRCRAGEAPGD